MGLALLLEDGPDAVKRAVELVLVLETEIQFTVLKGIHHIGNLLYVLPSGTDCGNHRRNDCGNDGCSKDMPDGKSHRPYFLSFA